VDARDPLLYRSEDLESYALELCTSKASFLLLNKADLLPRHIRKMWADHFDAAGMSYAFWSAARVTEMQQAAKNEALALGMELEVGGGVLGGGEFVWVVRGGGAVAVSLECPWSVPGVSLGSCRACCELRAARWRRAAEAPPSSRCRRCCSAGGAGAAARGGRGAGAR
jgi:hypothetical protein